MRLITINFIDKFLTPNANSLTRRGKLIEKTELVNLINESFVVIKAFGEQIENELPKYSINSIKWVLTYQIIINFYDKTHILNKFSTFMYANNKNSMNIKSQHIDTTHMISYYYVSCSFLK